MNQPGHVVLLGAAGTGTAFGAACALRRVWSQRVVIVAMDTNPRHLVTTGLLADVFETVPPAAAAAFPAALVHVMERHRVDTYLPLLPAEITVAARLHEGGGIPRDIKLLAPAALSCLACSDKWRLAEVLQRADIPTPRTAPAESPFPAQHYFLKLREGSGSRGARRIDAAEAEAMEVSERRASVLQEVCTGPEITVDVFVDTRSGFSRALCRERIEIKSGVATKCRLFEDDTLAQLALRVAGQLGLAGSFCLQVMRNASGWVVTDVNPRPGAATAMGVVSGNDFFAATFAHAWGQDPRPFFRRLERDCYVTRQYTEYQMPVPS